MRNHFLLYCVDIHLAVVGTHAAHTSAKLAMEGEYTEARVNAFSNQRLLQRTRYNQPTVHTLLVHAKSPSLIENSPSLDDTHYVITSILTMDHSTQI